MYISMERLALTCIYTLHIIVVVWYKEYCVTCVDIDVVFLCYAVNSQAQTFKHVKKSEINSKYYIDKPISRYRSPTTHRYDIV